MDWREWLHSRGISDATIAFYQIVAGKGFDADSKQADGVRYPTMSLDGQIALRWKNMDSRPKEQRVGAKYNWQGRTDGHLFYTRGGLAAAIQEEWNTIIWCEGEPDVWAIHSAFVNDPNKAAAATTMLTNAKDSEQTVLNVLKGIGLTIVAVYPDCDHAGMKKAYHVLKACEALDIEVIVYRLPAPITLDNGYDISDLWKDCQFDSAIFREKLNACPPIPLDELWLYGGEAPDGSRVGGSSQSGEIPFDQWKQWRVEWKQEIIRRCGSSKKVGRYEYYHCPVHPGRGRGEDKNPSLRFTDERTPGDPWPECSCDLGHDKDAWEQLGSAFGYSFEDFYRDKLPKRPRQESFSTNGSKHSTPPAADKPLSQRVTSFKQALREFRDDLDPNTPVTIEPFWNPIRSIHPFGGQAEILLPGQMVAIIGGTGTGKTSFLESLLIEPLMREGRSLVVDSREWKPKVFAKRSVQRHDGMTGGRYYRWMMWKKQAEQGVPVDQRVYNGRIGDDVRVKVGQVVDEMQAWPGDAYFISDPTMNVDSLIATVREMVLTSPVRITDVVLDYIQLIAAMDDGDAEAIVKMLFRIKNAMSPAPDFPGVITWVASQTTKESEKLRQRGKGLVDVVNAQYVRGDPFNLALTLNLVYEKGPDGKLTDQLKDYGHVRISKNSEGQKGGVNLGLDLPRNRWIDEVVEDTDE